MFVQGVYTWRGFELQWWYSDHFLEIISRSILIYYVEVEGVLGSSFIHILDNFSIKPH